MKIDNAAAAFRLHNDRFAVHEGDDGFFVMEKSEDTGFDIQHGEGMREADADALREQLAGRDGVTAVLREMISPIVIQAAMGRAEMTFRVDVTNQYNQGRKPSLALLLAIIDVLQAETT